MADFNEYKGVWVFCEQRQGALMSTDFELVSEARKLADELGCEVTGLLLGDNVEGIAKELGGYGADKVMVCDSPLLKDYTTDAYAKVVCDMVNEYKPEVLLIGATNIGRDLGPRCAARLHTGLTADATHLDIDTAKYIDFLKESSTIDLSKQKFDMEDRNLKMTRPAFGGHLMATIICPRFRPQMSTVRPGVMKKAPFDQAKADACQIVKPAFALAAEDIKTEVLSVEKAAEKLVDLIGADVIVSVGRGISKDVNKGIELAEQLAAALGGGVVGDLAGFTGSTFMRGLRIVQVPTTLLSMVDSSVGGKTAINLESGKNLVGTFCQPSLVCADVATLATLPEREWACGCGEIAKSAVIDSEDFFFWLYSHTDQLAAREPETVKEAVQRCIVFKASVVARDQEETKGVRECLNYGHTLAHAIETEAGYGVYSHGHAVAQGMRFASRLAVAHLGASMEFVQTQDALLDALGLPGLRLKAEPERLLHLMKGDKKVRSGKLRFVLPCACGEWEVCELEDEFVLEYLQAWQRSLS